MSTSSPSSLSFRQSIALTALATTLATTSLILSFQALRREHRTDRLKKQVGEDVEEWEKRNLDSGLVSPEEMAERHADGISTPGGGRRVKEWKKGEFDEGLIREQLTRNYNFLGEESMAKVRESYVVVVGCGGVGSWAATMLLRSGVGKILLIDFDLTTLSSLNRHACATLEDVGSPKVIAMQKYLKKVAPWAQVDVKVGLWRKGEGEAWLEGADWVVDAIDNINTKVDLLSHCHQQGIKVFASMGAGAKSDPTRVQIAYASSLNLASSQSAYRRHEQGHFEYENVCSGIPVVYSTEVPSEVKLLPLPEEEKARGPIKELGAFDDFRVRILPVLGPLPAIFGLNIASYILLDLARKPLTDFSEIKNRRKLYYNLEKGLSEREKRNHNRDVQIKLPINSEDVGFIFEDIHNGRSTIPPQVILAKPILIRWDKNRELTEDNVVIMGPKDAEKHEKACLIGDLSPEEVWGKDVVDLVEKKFQEVRKVLQWRRG
ncbi:tRNA threonylcarbamoyladenosine dehydratase, partial [Tremellales sp. Uapishka_1]